MSRLAVYVTERLVRLSAVDGTIIGTPLCIGTRHGLYLKHFADTKPGKT